MISDNELEFITFQPVIGIKSSQIADKNSKQKMDNLDGKNTI